MRGDGVSEDGGEQVPAGAIVAGLVALFAAALVVGVVDGVPLGFRHGQAAPGRETARAAVLDACHKAAVPDARLCFRGPGGEPVDFPAVQRRPWTAAVAGPGPRPAGAAQ